MLRRNARPMRILQNLEGQRDLGGRLFVREARGIHQDQRTRSGRDGAARAARRRRRPWSCPLPRISAVRASPRRRRRSPPRPSPLQQVAFRGARQSVPGKIEADDVELGLELAHPAVPGGVRVAEAMQQHQQRPIRVAPRPRNARGIRPARSTKCEAALAYLASSVRVGNVGPAQLRATRAISRSTTNRPTMMPRIFMLGSGLILVAEANAERGGLAGLGDIRVPGRKKFRVTS